MEIVPSSATALALPSDGHLPHFSPAEVLAEIHADHFDLDACRIWILRKIHREHGPRCPHCSATDISIDAFWRGKRICCRNCSGWFTASTGTILAGSTLDYRQLFLLGLMIRMSYTDTGIADRLQVNRKTVADWRRKLQGL